MMRGLPQTIVCILLVAFIVACAPNEAPANARFRNMTVDELAQRVADGDDFLLVNVRVPYAGHIAGTDEYWPYDAIPRDRLPEDKDTDIVVYCRSGRTSQIAAQTLIDLGYTRVTNVEGGMNAWRESGREILNATPET